MTEDQTPDAPCVQFFGIQPSHCLVGRDAPRDCAQGCPAYDADMLSALSLHPDERTRCEVWTRVMGYHRPVSAFNAGKAAEHSERKYFVEPR